MDVRTVVYVQADCSSSESEDSPNSDFTGDEREGRSETESSESLTRLGVYSDNQGARFASWRERAGRRLPLQSLGRALVELGSLTQ